MAQQQAIGSFERNLTWWVFGCIVAGAGLAYWLNKKLGVARCVAGPSALPRAGTRVAALPKPRSVNERSQRWQPPTM